ncbi:hypothetical protein KJ940_10030, partial [Myxococcota bacterium]|nr:hypothetical protein [Myxococcota bacterium]
MSGPDWRAWARLYEDEAEARRGAAAVEMRLEAARIYDTHLGDPRGAEAQLRAANRLSPDDPRPIHALADLHEAQGDLAEARRWLARAQTLTPAEDIDGRLALLCRLGVIAQDHLHDQEGAFAAFKEAILLAPDDLEILTRLRLALPEDDPRARLAILRRRPRPEAPEARAAILKQIARLEMQGGDAEAARLALEEALALCPTDEEALWASLALGGVGLKLEAAELSGLWRCIGALQEAHGAAWVAAGEGAPTAARRALAYHAEAQGAWAEAVALWPREAHEDEWRWALAMERAGDVEAARGALAERVALEPGDEIAEASLRRLDPIFEQLRAGGAYAADAAEAEGDLDAALRLTTTPQARARRLALRGDWVGAAAALESGDPLVWAEARLRAGDEDGAVALLRAHVEALSPTRRRLLLTLAQARGDVALERDLLAREALNAEGAYRAALLLRRAALEGSDVEGWARRVALLREVLALTPGARAAHRALGRLYFEAGDVAALADLYQEELRRAALSEAERADRLRRLAELYEYRLDRPAAASECYEALLHAAPLTAIEGLERIYERTARPQALAAVLKRRAAAASAPKEAAWAYLRYGELLHERVEDHAAAAEAYRHALSLDPTLRPAAMALERITLRGGGDPAAFYEEALAQPTPFEDAQTLRHKRDLCLGTPGAASEGALGRWAVLRRAYDLGDWPTAAAALRAEAEAGAEAERADLNALAFRLMRGHPQAAAFIEGLGEAAGLEARLSLDVEGVAAPW